MGRKIRKLRILKTAEKVIKGTDAGSIPEFKSTEDSKKWVALQLGSPVSQGMDFEINRQQIGTVHTGGGLGFETKTEYFERRSSSE